MNSNNWTELTGAYGADFNPGIAPERNVLAAVVNLRSRQVAVAAIAPVEAFTIDVFPAASDPPTQSEFNALVSQLNALGANHVATVAALNAVIVAMRSS